MQRLKSNPDIAVWIMALGIAFGLALFLTAAFKDNPWDDHTYGQAPPVVAGMPAPHRDGREKMVCSSCHVVLPAKAAAGAPPGAVLPIVQGMPAPHRDGREKLACTSCHTIISKNGAIIKAGPAAAKPPVATRPQAAASGGAASSGAASSSGASGMTVALAVTPLLPQGPAMTGAGAGDGGGDGPATPFEPYRFQGKVVKVAGTGVQSVWGDVYILLDDGFNKPIWIDLAPRWYLQSGGCVVRAGMFVKGTALRDPGGEGGALAYGMTVMVNGDLCTLRDHHMTGLWTHHGGGGTDAE